MKNDIISMSFKDYKQETWQGACELYAFLWGCLHTKLKDALLNNITKTNEGYEIKSNAFHSNDGNELAIKVNNKEVREVSLIPKGKHCDLREYNPSNDPTLIAIGLAYATIMKVAIHESLDEVGKDEGYLIDQNGTKKKNLSCSGDLLLNNQIHYLPSNEALILKPDGNVLVKNNDQNYDKYSFQQFKKDNLFIIYPYYGHAHLYYYENNVWKKFDNQVGIKACGNNTLTLKSPNQDRIRIIVNQQFKDNKQNAAPNDHQAAKRITHQELMKHLADCLNVKWDDVYSGIAVESRLVSDAGITRKQTGALFRELTSKEGITFFDLKLSKEECHRFTTHYNETFPGLIVDQPEITQKGDTRFFMKTDILYSNVAIKWRHYKLMEHLADCLNTEWKNVYLGTDVENRLVKDAGIAQKQTGALFRPLPSKKGITFFDLKLSKEEHHRFMAHYNKNFPGLIVNESKLTLKEKQGVLLLRDGYTRVFMKTDLLYNNVATKWRSNALWRFFGFFQSKDTHHVIKNDSVSLSSIKPVGNI